MGALKINQSTVLKTDPRKQAAELPANQKYPVAAGILLPVSAATPSLNNHLQVTLLAPVQGYSTWYAFMPHVMVVWGVLEALQATMLKRDPLKQADQLADAEKAALATGEKLFITAAISAANNHWQVELAAPLKEFTTWYAFVPHVQVRWQEGGKLEAARDRQKVFNDYLALQVQEGSNQNHLSFLDRGVNSSAYNGQLTQFAERLRVPLSQTVVSLGPSLQLTGSAQTVTFGTYPNRGILPSMDGTGLNFLHTDITEACVCVGSLVNGQMRSRWLGRNAVTNAQFWSATKIVPILNVLSQANTSSVNTPIGTCTIVDSQGVVSSVSFKDAAIDVVSYRKDDIAANQFISNRTADMFKRFSTLAGLEAWFRSQTGNPMRFRGYYENDPLILWPQLRSPTALLVSAQSEGVIGENLVSASDLTRIMTMIGWHVFTPPGAKVPGAQWHSLATLIECLGYDSARYVDVAINTLGIAAQIRDVVILSKLGFGSSDSRDRTELTYTALVQFVDARHQAANQPAILRTLAMTLRAAVRRVGTNGKRDLDEEARQIDSRMAAEITEILRRVVTQELA
jgi:hypothetical protein